MGQPLYVPEDQRSPHLPFPAADGRVLRKFSCVIRWEPDPNSQQGRSRPYVYVNDTHPAPGILAVWCDYASGRLIVKGDGPFGPTLAPHIQVDETLAKAGFGAIGPSIGPEVQCQLTRDGLPFRADDPAFLIAPLAPYGNVWFGAESLTSQEVPS